MQFGATKRLAKLTMTVSASAAVLLIMPLSGCDDPHQADRRVSVRKAVETLRDARDRLGGHEVNRRERRDVREPPLLVTNRRNPELDEARSAACPEILEPARATARPLVERAGERHRFRFLC